METSINRQELTKDILSNLEEVNVLRTEYKALQQIYQCEAKQNTALWFRLPINTYYNYSYVEWREASKRLEQFLDLMRHHRTSFEEWVGYDFYRLSYGEWKNDFIRFCEDKGIQLVKPYIR